MQIKGENYNVWYDRNSGTVNFTGALRLAGMEEYGPILQLLNSLAAMEPSRINLNLKQLEFLNSSGITMLSKFVIEIRKKNNIKMAIQGSNEIPWQGKSLKNLQRLMPGLALEFQ
jgi:hypothetical protein